MLNRSALILRPADPYIQWALGLDDSGVSPSADGEQTVYLLPGWESDEEAEQILSEIWEALFERELFAWCNDEQMWPKERTRAKFNAWFAIEMHSLIEDLCAYPVLDDEDQA